MNVLEKPTVKKSYLGSLDFTAFLRSSPYPASATHHINFQPFPKVTTLRVASTMPPPPFSACSIALRRLGHKLGRGASSIAGSFARKRARRRWRNRTMWILAGIRGGGVSKAFELVAQRRLRAASCSRDEVGSSEAARADAGRWRDRDCSAWAYSRATGALGPAGHSGRRWAFCVGTRMRHRRGAKDEALRLRSLAGSARRTMFRIHNLGGSKTLGSNRRCRNPWISELAVDRNQAKQGLHTPRPVPGRAVDTQSMTASWQRRWIPRLSGVCVDETRSR